MSDQASQPIESAEGVALFRAFGALESNEQFRNPDRYARSFLSEKSRRVFRAMRWLRPFVKWRAERSMPGSYWYLYVRTRHFDRIVCAAAADGIEQLVILGAGYDSRVLRFREALRHVTCFEVDHPATQAAKRAHLERMSEPPPKNLVFVPIDFNAERLEDVLPSSGFRGDKRTLFLWEGVCLYLPERSIDAVFEFVRKASCVGSSIAFDYITEAVSSGRDTTALGASETRAGTSGLGEPIRFGIDPEACEAFLAQRGFEQVENLLPEELSQLYLARQDGSRVGRMLGFTQIALARVSGDERLATRALR